MGADVESAGSFGDLTPLLAPRSVAVVGASDREGNLGGLAVGFLQKFGYRGPAWRVNAARPVVAGLPCFAHLRPLPSRPDLVIVALRAETGTGGVRACIPVGSPGASVC